MKLLIQGAQVFNGYELQQQDVLLQDGVVLRIGSGLSDATAECINAQGHILSPAFTDLHVHFRQPGYEDKETIKTGAAAALAGGFGTVCTMPNLMPVPDSVQNLKASLQAIKTAQFLRILPYGSLTVGQLGQRPSDVERLAAFVPGYTDDGNDVANADVMREAMRAAAKTGRLVAVHCEDASLHPQDSVCVQAGSQFARTHGFEGHTSESEWHAVERNISLAEETGCRLHICHASTKQTFELVRSAKQRGLPVTCEVTPHNLLLCCDDITENDGRFKMNPPLRTASDVESAVEALQDGTIDAIATDHAPHTAQQKDGGFAHSANGVVGLETAFAAVYTGLAMKNLVPTETLLQCLTWKPRGVLQESPQHIAEGEACNLVLLDIETERAVNPQEFCTMGRATPFAMHRMWGWPTLTLIGGQRAYCREEKQ